MYQLQDDSQKNMPTSSVTNGVHSSRVLFNLERVRKVEGPVYDHAPNDSWGDLTRGLKQCGSLKNSARKVFAEIEKEKSELEQKISKTNAPLYLCKCKQSTCPSNSSNKSSLAAILNAPDSGILLSSPATW